MNYTDINIEVMLVAFLAIYTLVKRASRTAMMLYVVAFNLYFCLSTERQRDVAAAGYSVLQLRLDAGDGTTRRTNTQAVARYRCGG